MWDTCRDLLEAKVPKRYVIVILAGIGMCLIHAQRTNMGITVVAILDDTVSSKVKVQERVSINLDCCVQSDLFHSVRLCKGIETMASTGQSKISIFW